jgi:hypothetical protein
VPVGLTVNFATAIFPCPAMRLHKGDAGPEDRFRAKGHFLFWRGPVSVFRPHSRRDSPMLTRVRRSFSQSAPRLSKGNETHKKSFFTGVCSGIESPVTARPSGRTRDLVAKPEDGVWPDNFGIPVIPPSGRNASSTGPLPNRFQLDRRQG